MPDWYMSEIFAGKLKNKIYLMTGGTFSFYRIVTVLKISTDI